MSTTLEQTTTTIRRDDSECQTAARRYLQDLMGMPPDDLVWDIDHHLQGHAHCAGHEIVVIASRDTLHQPVVLTPQDWDAIRRSAGPTRCEMLKACAIASGTRLREVLFGN